MVGLLLGYAVFLLLVGLYAGRRIHDAEDYLVAGRRLPLSLAWGTLLATWFGAATVLGASQAAYEEGVRGTLLDPFASGLALIVAGCFFARRMWEMKLLTMGDFYRRRFGPRTEVLATVVSAAGYFPWIAAQYLALARIGVAWFDVALPTGILVAASFVLVLTLSGGMWSVTLTDMLQVVLVLAGLATLAWQFAQEVAATLGVEGSTTAWHGVRYVWTETDPALRTLLPEAGLVAAVAWSVTLANGTLGNLPGQDLMQRIFAARDGRTAERACLLAGSAYLVWGLLPVGLGLAARLTLGPDQSDNVLLLLAQRYLSPVMVGVFVLSLVSIVVSTCTSALLSPSALIAHNLLNRLPWCGRRPLATNRAAVVLVTALSIPIALLSDSILALLEDALAIGLVALVVPFLAGAFREGWDDRAGLWSVAWGGTAWLLHQLAVGFSPDWALVPADSSWGAILASVPAEVTGVGASLLGLLVGQRSRV